MFFVLQKVYRPFKGQLTTVHAKGPLSTWVIFQTLSYDKCEHSNVNEFSSWRSLELVACKCKCINALIGYNTTFYWVLDKGRHKHLWLNLPICWCLSELLLPREISDLVWFLFLEWGHVPHRWVHCLLDTYNNKEMARPCQNEYMEDIVCCLSTDCFIRYIKIVVVCTLSC